MSETSDGLRFHIQAHHQVPSPVISQMEQLAYEQYGVDTFTGLTTMHGALHRASELLEQAETEQKQNGRTCTGCHIRPPVVILSGGVRLCASCALTSQAGS